MRPVIAEIPKHQPAAEQPFEHFPSARTGKQIIRIAKNEFQRIRTAERHAPLAQQFDLVDCAKGRL